MSDLFQGLDASDAGDGPGAGRSRRPLLLVGGLAVAGLLGAGYLVLGGSGSGDDLAASAPVVASTRVPSARPSASPTPDPTPVAVPAALAASSGRNPFTALYVVPSGVSGGGGSPAVVAGSPAVVTGSPAPTSTASPAPAATYPLKLVGVDPETASPRKASVLIGTTTTKHWVGEHFGATGELVVLGWATDAAGATTGVWLQVGAEEPVQISIGRTVQVH